MAPRTVGPSMTSPISGMAGKLRSAAGQPERAGYCAWRRELTERWAQCFWSAHVVAEPLRLHGLALRADAAVEVGVELVRPQRHPAVDHEVLDLLVRQQLQLQAIGFAASSRRRRRWRSGRAAPQAGERLAETTVRSPRHEGSGRTRLFVLCGTPARTTLLHVTTPLQRLKSLTGSRSCFIV